MSVFSAEAYAWSAYSIPVAVTMLLMLVFGASVFARHVSRVSGALLGVAGVASVWMFAFTFMYSATDPRVALTWAKIAYLGVPLLAPAIYQFAVEMLRIVQHRRPAVAAGWIVGVAFSIFSITTPILITGVQRYWWGYYPRYDPLNSILFLFFFFGYLVAALIEFVRAFPQAQGVERERIRLLLVAFGVAYFGCVDFLPKYGIAVYPFGYVALLGFVIVVAHTVRRYDLVPISPLLAAKEIIDTMADALFVCDRDGRIQFVNATAENLLGFESRDFLGRRIEELMATQADNMNETLRRKSIRNAEYAFKAKDGDPVDLTLSIAPVYNQGESAGAVIIGRDIRDRKRAEREIRSAVTLLESTLESTADGILVTGNGDRILTYNQRFVDMWRIPRTIMATGDAGAAMIAVLEQLLHPDDFRHAIDGLSAQPDAESFDLIEFKDGRRFERYSIGRRIEGVDTIRVWSFRDVTARFAAEDALRESEVRYRLLFEQNAAGVCVTKTDGTIIDCNTTFALMLGYRRAELVGRNMGELYERRIERDELAEMLDDVTMLNGVEIELRRKDDTHVWVLQNLVLVGERDSAVIHATLVDISDRKRAEEQIEFHAYHDVLTHLPNRKLFTDRLTQALTRARRSGRSTGVMFIDLDHFKTINDTLGHTAGDELLLEMSQRLRQCVREDDTVARLGGDEFTIILNELRHPEDAAQVAEKILEAVEVPLWIAGMPIEVTASIGIALFPVDGADAESLLRNADSAMYRAKESGRNNFQLCTDDMKRRANERLSLETRLRKGVHDDQLVLHYQPQVSLVTGRIVGAEALVRWNDPDRGLVGPSAFIPLAEETRLIRPLGEWVLRTACKQAKEWRDLGVDHMRVAVNLSVRQFQQHDLVEMVLRALAETGLAPEALELEITETTAMQNGEATVDILRALRNIGVGISMDDFGTGYSSLNYLKRFPINAVKIDRAFIRDLDTSAGDAAIVTAVIGIARALELRVVAEGVETEHQLAFLQRRECDEAQGYYFGRPVPADELTADLVERPTIGRRERLTI
ncbi:MAG TPA: EAL domain-containing protein [Thermoanaerobaculia bacterium]|nr:EAL domain-containing protein [Thermoanaerobaculia bacterium]